MSRSGYTEDCEYLELYRNSVERALKGKRGQKFLRELAEAMDTMAVHELHAGTVLDAEGGVCAMGTVCIKRGLEIVPEFDDPWVVAEYLGITKSMASEIAWINDEANLRNETPSERWTRVRKWVEDNLQK